MWQIYLQLTPADNLYIIMVGCALILAVIGIIIIGKHIEERKEDLILRPKMPDF
jgi:hypothetical protein